MVAASFFGYLFVNGDRGDTWRKLPKELGESRTVAVLPN